MSQRDVPAALVHNGWRLLHSGKPTSLREPWWIIVSAEPALRWRVFHVEHRGSYRGDDLCGERPYVCRAFLEIFVRTVHFIRYDHAGERHVGSRSVTDARTMVGSIDDKSRNNCRLKRRPRCGTFSRVPRGTLLD